MKTLYDGRNHANVTQADLPADISPAEIAQFCAAHSFSFYSLDSIVNDAGLVADLARRPDRFRVATQEYPPRGHDILFDKVREWKVAMAKSNIEEARKLCAELPVIQDRLFKAGLIKTSRAMDAVVRAVGFEAAELIEANLVITTR